jgi:formiminoglutamase
MMEWLEVHRGDAPLIVSVPHAGTDIPADVEAALVSPWIGRQDADWHVDRLYDFAAGLGATIVATSISRTVVDVNRDPSGASLYPGQATTELCPTTTFDGEPLWRAAPDEAEIARRVDAYFRPYHAALEAEIGRLRALHPAVVLYEAHSIRSVVPRLFEGELPQFNIGTNSGQSCAPALAAGVAEACSGEGRSVAPPSLRPSPEYSIVIDGRFKGGWTTRYYGRPEGGVHAIQMELAMRGYLDEPTAFTPETWPVRYDDERAAPMRETLECVLRACIAFAKEQA